MEKRIVFKRPDGTCGIVTPSEYGLQRRTIEEIAKKDVPRPIIGETSDGRPMFGEQYPYRIVDTSNIPSDRYFRNAWTDDNITETVDVDMKKACDIHMDVIRRGRDKKMKELDIETLKGNDVQPEKQALRDIPQTFDLSKATTPEELKELWPEELAGYDGN